MFNYMIKMTYIMTEKKGTLSRAIESIWMDQLKISELNMTVCNMKNLLDETNSKLETTEEKYKFRLIEMIKSEA